MTPGLLGDALRAFEDEAMAFAQGLAGLPAQAWGCRTRCVPWSVADVVGHVITVLARVPDMIAEPAPDRSDTTATGYYRADHRFSENANADRIRTAHRRAAGSDGTSLVHDLAVMARTVIASSRQEPIGRIVRTRHGDAILLSDFLTTRVVELAVHGLDVTDALGREPWLTVAAAEHLQQLMFGPAWRTATARLGWDPVTLLRRTTGRDSAASEDSAELARLGFRSWTLG